MDDKSTILKQAKEIAKTTKTWADFSNALFDPFDGILVRALPTQEARGAFRKTKEYKEIQALLQQKMSETGLVEGATPKKSGKFLVRLPRSLHAALDREAETEGTSLNQLVVTKLALQLENVAGGRLASIIQAFGEVRNGCSVDRVIFDPQLNRRFLRRCRELGLSGTDFDLNWALVNARKKGDLSHLPKTKRYTVREIDEFEYASEMAARYMQKIKNVSLDQIICDPELAEEFDTYASQLAPGFTSLQYRWAAFSLRKARRLTKKMDQIPEIQPYGRMEDLELEKIPEVGGLYVFSSNDTLVFTSQTDNLRHRLERHIKVSDFGLPCWLWDVRHGPLHLGLALLPGIARGVRQAMQLALIKRLKPVLNFPRKVA